MIFPSARSLQSLFTPGGRLTIYRGDYFGLFKLFWPGRLTLRNIAGLTASFSMKFVKHWSLLYLLLMVSSAVWAGEETYYRIFLNPTLNGHRLDYCQHDRVVCGKKVADQYCQFMGFERSNQNIEAFNVGLTHYIDNRFRCKGWDCNGFKNIRCVGTLSHNPPVRWHYRYRKFVYPRFNNYRLDWCYDGKSGCGRKAAFSFCRHLGYMDVKSFKRQENVAATKAIRNQKLCFQNNCAGFSAISCSR